jgi:DEAD/DEAH box helicase domain-containing protein
MLKKETHKQKTKIIKIEENMNKLLGKNIVVYDCEIKNEIDLIKITWADHHLMGLSVAALFDYLTGDYQVYFENDIQDLAKRLNNAELIVGFNTKAFDNRLIRGCGADLKADSDLKNWDILEQSRISTGWNESKRYPTGMKLDDHLMATFGKDSMKTENGANAPKMFQSGQIGKLVSYCLADVRREKMLFEHIVQFGWVETATHGKRTIDLSVVNRLLK